MPSLARPLVRALPVLLLALALPAGCGSTRTAPSAAPPRATAALPRSTSSHVVVIVQENKEEADVIGRGDSPYVNRLARRYGLAVNSYGVRHPSLPNYFALTSGSTHGISSDCYACHVGARNIVDQLESAGTSWKAYLEGAPGPCYLDSDVGRYAKRHNPFAYYDDVAQDPARCHRLVPLTRLAADLRAGTLPTYVWITPDVCNDTHDCGVATGDRFLAGLVPSLLRELGPHGLLVLTWDEGRTDDGCCDGSDGGRIATILAGPDIRPGSRTETPIDHYAVLGTIEDLLGLPRLGAATDARHGTLAALFK